MRSKLIVAASVIVCILFFYVGIGFSQEKVSGSQWTQMGDKAKINWSEGYIEAVGIGAPPERYIGKPNARPMALRAAKVDAYRNLLEATKGVRVDSTTVVKDFTVESDVINTQVEGLVQGAKIVNQDYLSDGTVEVTLRMPVAGGHSLISVLNIDNKSEPTFVPPDRLIPPAGATPIPLPPAAEKKSFTYDSSKPVTGVIFDLEGRAFERQLLPVVITVAGDNKQLTVYSVKSVKPAVIRSYGVVRYADNGEQAKKNPYIGDNTVVIPVTDVTKENMIVIGTDGARVIRETTMHGNDYLGDAKVIVSSK
jgi:hypothetical protein